jgi:hypothetical protein
MIVMVILIGFVSLCFFSVKMMFSINKTLYYMPLIISSSAMLLLIAQGFIPPEAVVSTFMLYFIAPYFMIIFVALMLVNKVPVIKKFMDFCLPQDLR